MSTDSNNELVINLRDNSDESENDFFNNDDDDLSTPLDNDYCYQALHILL